MKVYSVVGSEAVTDECIDCSELCKASASRSAVVLSFISGHGEMH